MKYIETDAAFSPCTKYRYTLYRRWSAETGITAAFIGLNPSTADATQDDPTIRRCVGFAMSWGCVGMYMLNAYAFRATDPKVMKAHHAPIGTDNNDYIQSVSRSCYFKVACWGAHILSMRQESIKAMVKGLQCFGLTAGGFPKHPLYLAKDTHLIDFS